VYILSSALVTKISGCLLIAYLNGFPDNFQATEDNCHKKQINTRPNKHAATNKTD